jgi:hypothetical protein
LKNFEILYDNKSLEKESMENFYNHQIDKYKTEIITLNEQSKEYNECAVSLKLDINAKEQTEIKLEKLENEFSNFKLEHK